MRGQITSRLLIVRSAMPRQQNDAMTQSGQPLCKLPGANRGNMRQFADARD